MADNTTEQTQQDQVVGDLKDLGDAVSASDDSVARKEEAQAELPERTPKIDAQGRSYGTGRRKESVARVWLKPGKGRVVVNGEEQDKYFGRKTHLLVINQPFLVVGRVNEFDIYCTVKGGGLSGQAGAVRHGLSRALENYDPQLRPPLKAAGMLTRDSRVVERKKIGKHKARRSKQWAKR